MSLERKFLLSHLLLIVIVSGLFVALEGFMSRFNWSWHFLYPGIFVILFVAGLLSFLFTRLDW